MKTSISNMFKNKQVKYLRVRGKELWIRYKGKGKETFLTKGKVDISKFWNTQRDYYLRAQEKTRLKALERKSALPRRVGKKQVKEYPYWLVLN